MAEAFLVSTSLQTATMVKEHKSHQNSDFPDRVKETLTNETVAPHGCCPNPPLNYANDQGYLNGEGPTVIESFK